jgi:hypothetical protein
MNSSNVETFGTFTIIVLSMMVVVSFVESPVPQNIYAQSTTNNDSAISKLDDLVNKLVTGVKLEI